MINILEYDFFAPKFLWFLLFVPLFLAWNWKLERRRAGDWKYTGIVEDQQKYNSIFIHILRRILLINNSFVLFLLIISLAKPYSMDEYLSIHREYKYGIDIILTIDISGSMLENDFYPNRIEVAKKVAMEFVKNRSGGDRIGLVAYAGQAFTACPATIDYALLERQIEVLNCELNIEGGTAIGVGLGTAVARLRSDDIPSKVVILLTDGSNNAGYISPIEAAEMAKNKNVRVYTIGIGRPKKNITSDADLDEETLKNIAKIANGKYFRATNEQVLRNIYTEIDKMEKKRIKDREFKSQPPANPQKILNLALFLMIIGWIIQQLLFWSNE